MAPPPSVIAPLCASRFSGAGSVSCAHISRFWRSPQAATSHSGRGDRTSTFCSVVLGKSSRTVQEWLPPRAIFPTCRHVSQLATVMAAVWQCRSTLVIVVISSDGGSARRGDAPGAARAAIAVALTQSRLRRRARLQLGCLPASRSVDEGPCDSWRLRTRRSRNCQSDV